MTIIRKKELFEKINWLDMNVLCIRYECIMY